METVTTKRGETFNLNNVEKTNFWIHTYDRNGSKIIEDIGKLKFEIRFVSENTVCYSVDPTTKRKSIERTINFIVDILVQLYEVDYLNDVGFERNVDQILGWLTNLYNYETDSIQAELESVKPNKSNNTELTTKNVDSFLNDIDSVLKDIKVSSSSFHETNVSSESRRGVRYPM